MSALLPERLYTADAVRRLDRCAIEEHGIAGILLMERAAQAAFQCLLKQWNSPATITVLCGAGNNAGDGYLLACLAHQRDIPVTVIQVGDAGKLSGDAETAYQRLTELNIDIIPWGANAMPERGILVDALLGTGLSGLVRGAFVYAIEAINHSPLPVLAIDVPSGLCSDTGQILGHCVEADHCMTFIGVKQGLLTAEGPAHSGELHFDDLQVPSATFQAVKHSAQLYRPHIKQLLPSRARNSHKGHFGHLLVIGGDHGMGGAALLAAHAAARCGAGLVSLATRSQHVNASLSRCPEVMVHGVESGQDLFLLLQKPTVIAIGPGLGQNPWGQQLLQQVLEHTDSPMIIDADGLRILAQGKLPKPKQRHLIITPHPGEAALLLNTSNQEIQQNRFQAVQQLQESLGGSVVLKGCGSLVSDGQRVDLLNVGNPGMACGGMGDVLTGVIGALLAQQVPTDEAARLGAYLHSRAADLAADEHGQRGLIASDLLAPLRRLINGGQS